MQMRPDEDELRAAAGDAHSPRRARPLDPRLPVQPVHVAGTTGQLPHPLPLHNIPQLFYSDPFPVACFGEPFSRMKFYTILFRVEAVAVT